MTGPTWEIRQGDVLERLREMPDNSVHCVVTSPPYWGLRDYGTASWDGGDPDCGHSMPAIPHTGLALAAERADGNHRNESGTRAAKELQPYRSVCGRCGARRIDQQLGLEATPALYLERMVAVFREVRRVLRPDGTCWVNMGDSYNANTGAGFNGNKRLDAPNRDTVMRRPPGLKPKDLIGMPWRLAFALQDDGWWLRSEIIWAKPNPMPESVTDRPTKSHEQIFLLTKSARYFYDADAIREPHTAGHLQAQDSAPKDRGDQRGFAKQGLHDFLNPAGRNARTVWTIATQPYPEAHFATFPEELPRRCIMAGTSERGVCPQCGAPWTRVVERAEAPHTGDTTSAYPEGTTANRLALLRQASRQNGHEYAPSNTTTGWQPSCYHDDVRRPSPIPATVLDPFAGSGTSILVALQLNRSAIGIELSPTYAQLARRRVRDDAPLFNTMSEQTTPKT